MPLDQADKEWLSGQLGRIESVMNERFAHSESVMDDRFEGARLETREQLDRLESLIVRLDSEVNQRFEGARLETREQLDRLESLIVRLDSEVNQRIEAARVDGSQQLERVETNLLTAFHKWASPLDARVRSHTSNLRAIDLKLEELEDRIRQLEKPSSPDDLSSAA